MANLKERNIALVSKDSEGVTTIDYPLTSTEQVEGLEEYVKANGGSNLANAKGVLPIANGGTGASSLEQARENLGIDKVAGLPVGHEFFTTNPNIPAGCIPLLGGEYSRTTYADLWAWVQTQAGYLIEESAWQVKAAANGGNVPFYSKGNGTTTFRVPALKCWVKGADSISEVGDYLAAGLPNIEGTISNAFLASNTTFTGAFTGQKSSGYDYSGISSNRWFINLNASDSNPIYGSSDTVQPPSIVGLWCVKAYGTVTNVGSTDVANISAGLTQAETRISALENHGAGATVVESYRNGTEWYRVWSDGWLEQGGMAENAVKITVTFLKPFTNKCVGAWAQAWGTNSSIYAYSIYHTDVTSMVIYANGGAISYQKQWFACGY